MSISAERVHEVLSRHQLADGLPFVVDLERSHGVWLHDARTGEDLLDAFTCFASFPLGYNHPGMDDPAFRETLLRVALTKLSNADLYTREMAEFVDAFATRVTPPGFPYHFWISGGALAVENAIKTAFDWKARKLGRTDFEADVNDLTVLHLNEAFHGRSGYTLSLTNTVPDKIGLFPKFHWPRIHNPKIVYDLDGGIANDIEAEEARACGEIEAFLTRCPAGRRGTLAAILVEPMQGEGGDNHFRPEFLRKLRRYADEHEALLVYDEVQTGFYGSGRPWLWQHLDVAPDVVAFGKKTQVCGIYASRRLDEVDDHVFRMSSRINSTWGGNLVDMVRCRRYIEIVEQYGLAENITRMGQRTIDGLRAIARATGAFTNVRGVGSLIAFTLPDARARDGMLDALRERKALALAAGVDSVRFRLPLVIDEGEVDELLARVEACVARVAARG
ncbi:MAG: L-lysine 6-transaminase [Planctomycetota bacterium]|jgi:L-lysine 6-transaminase